MVRWKIFNKCLTNLALHLKAQMLRCFILQFFYIILSSLSIILICPLSDPLAVKQLRPISNSSFIYSFHHRLHLMPSGSSWSIHYLHKFYCYMMNLHTLIFHRYESPHLLVTSTRKTKHLSWPCKEDSQLISIHYLVANEVLQKFTLFFHCLQNMFVF